jgi:hypothetical protein
MILTVTGNGMRPWTCIGSILFFWISPIRHRLMKNKYGVDFFDSKLGGAREGDNILGVLPTKPF